MLLDWKLFIPCPLHPTCPSSLTVNNKYTVKQIETTDDIEEPHMMQSLYPYKKNSVISLRSSSGSQTELKMKFLYLLCALLFLGLLQAPGSTQRPHSDLECQRHEGLCLHGHCPSPWHVIGTCNIAEHWCCRRMGPFPRLTMKKEKTIQW
ncbi:uncharacterized protein LOC144584879 [Pogona vitticeps]